MIDFHLRTILILSFSFLIILQVNAQISTTVLNRDAEGHKYVNFEFRDENGHTLKIIHFKDINPYKDKNPNSELIKAKYGDKKYSDEIHTQVSTMNEYSGITFNYKVRHEDGVVEELRESTIILFNNRGDEIYRPKNTPHNANEPLISKGGKYLGFYFITSEYGGGANNIVGFRIYDITADLVLHDIKTTNIAGGYQQNNVFAFRVPTPTGSSEYYVFEPESSVLYKKEFSRHEIGLKNRFEQEGVIFNLETGGQVLEKYADTFEIVKSH